MHNGTAVKPFRKKDTLTPFAMAIASPHLAAILKIGEQDRIALIHTNPIVAKLFHSRRPAFDQAVLSPDSGNNRVPKKVISGRSGQSDFGRPMI